MPDRPSSAPGGSPRAMFWDQAGWRALAALALILLLGLQPVPLAVTAAFRSAQSAAARQDYAAAADLLASAAARLPYDGSLVYRAGLADISAERFESAVERLQSAAALDGWTPARRVALGDAYLGLGDRASALAQWELALEDLPEDDGLLARLANSYEAEGRYADAIATLNALARVRVGDPAVPYRLALLTAVTAPADALARLTRVADLSPDLAPQAQAIRRAIEAGLAAGDEAYTFGRVGLALIQFKEWGLAELALRRAAALNPEYADAQAYLGFALDMQGQDGRAAYEAALNLAPDSPLPKYFLGLYWRRHGEAGTALNFLQEAQALDPENPALAAEVGETYAVLRDLPNAEVWFTEAVRLAPENADFWLLLARFYVEHEYHVADLGLPAARMAAGLNPESALAADALGHALVLTGDHTNGEKGLERAIALDPQLPSAYYHLGLLYTAQGRTKEAQAALNHALALDPQGAYGGLALRALAQLPP
jgi:tetratricopeptide (TPR) repeat protein